MKCQITDFVEVASFCRQLSGEPGSSSIKRMCCAAHVLCLHARVHKYTRPHALTLCVDWLNARCFESDSSVQMLVVSLI